MAGPNLELFKFGVYVFFPILVMVHYGDLDWYEKYVLPEKSKFLRLNKYQENKIQRDINEENNKKLAEFKVEFEKSKKIKNHPKKQLETSPDSNTTGKLIDTNTFSSISRLV
ncbi:hypothetical protein O181_031609 [Austropuccinia psidii MF-1]|uniref:Uncharacterized protein n=1 Tax=Austropuccinia psidii MF-1 TaxID=1389203 RepID=A0A9Q3CV79_9BASI|nr:hypothetical protein [Austropuccinia psidii MF-1]